MFRFHKADSACSLNFEELVCQIKIDKIYGAVPAKGDEFDCPNCQAQLIIHYVQHERS